MEQARTNSINLYKTDQVDRAGVPMAPKNNPLPS
ncbi:MAG: hypothetical protein ACI92E_002132, partial [Oceanicoccus sp.]